MRLGTVATVAVLAYAATAGAQDVPAGCVQIGPPGGVYVDLDDVGNAQTIAHARAAVANGQPRLLHWEPSGAKTRRVAALRGIRTVPGRDRDEYPPAASAEGGAGADVALIEPRDNRSAGQRMGAQLRIYCPGQAFILEP